MFCTSPTDAFNQTFFVYLRYGIFFVYLRYGGLSRLVHIGKRTPKFVERRSSLVDFRLRNLSSSGTVFVIKAQFSIFDPLCKDWKTSRLKRDNALQNCEYINIVRILESFFVVSVFVITDIGDSTCIF